MKIGIIGSGRVGFSMGKYLTDKKVEIVGYYDRHPERAAEAAHFTGTDSYPTMEALVEASDTLFLTTPDAEIAKAWDCIAKMSEKSNLCNKIICHFSGSLSSVVFQGIEATGASCASIHPMLAFSDKYSSYQQLNHAFLTIEGMPMAVEKMCTLFTKLGNQVCEIDKSCKELYHCAASVLSNQVIAVLESGYEMLEQCGFSREAAMQATHGLVLGNVENVLAKGCQAALTGPIERGDALTVKKHLAALKEDEKNYEMYVNLGEKLVQIAEAKNPEKDYQEIKQIFESERK